MASRLCSGAVVVGTGNNVTVQASHRSRDSIPLHSTYLTASDLGLRAPRETRERLWGTIPRDQALVLLASMLADADSNGQLAGDRRDIDRDWVARIEDPNLRQRVQIGLTLRNVLLAPQLLVLAIREALELCPHGPALNGASGTDAVIECLLGIGDEEQAGRVAAGDPTRWAGLDPKLAADLVANMYFNSSIALHHLMATPEAIWTSPWPDLAPRLMRGLWLVRYSARLVSRLALTIRPRPKGARGGHEGRHHRSGITPVEQI